MLEKGDNQPTKQPCRSIGTMTDSTVAVHVPREVDTDDTCVLQQSTLHNPLRQAIDHFAKETNAGTFIELLDVFVPLLHFNDVLNLANKLWKVLFTTFNINTNPADFIVLSLDAMLLLQQANKSNLVYKVAYCLGTKRPGSDQPLLPLERMPFGLIQYQFDFFRSTNSSQVC